MTQLLSSIVMAFQSLASNKVRAALTMLGIIIGVGAVITMTAIGQGASQAVQNQINSMGTNALLIFPGAVNVGGISSGTGGSQRLTEDDANALKKSEWLAAVAPTVGTSVQVVAADANWSTRITGTTPDYFRVRNWPVVSGSEFTDADAKSGTKVCILGKTVVTNLFGEAVDPVGQTIRIKHEPFTVVGVLQEKGSNSFGQDQDDIIIAPFATVQRKLMGITWANNIMASSITAESSAAASADATQILRQQHKLLPNDDNDFQIRSQVELAAAAEQSTATMTNLLTAAAVISLLVGGIGIMNIMLVSVTERTREIGIRKSIGAKFTNILFQFLTEAITLSLVGGVIGVVLGYIASSFVSSSNGWILVISPQAVGISFGAAAFVGIFFGWYPARKAARLNPIEALRYE
ncbi:MAG: ABC transporter permease [Bacteroidota bacterium]|nr:ABC transporter permease [Bacteroidota bacterium]MDP4233350.1 ABC transporter permease [Bacteroidota bacterium]MDP4242217.1 ABC transporter permease [Bacteroidota bacterium]MDP4286973.1 ABC transporter permease [Bacteroidota bacterium]